MYKANYQVLNSYFQSSCHLRVKNTVSAAKLNEMQSYQRIVFVVTFTALPIMKRNMPKYKVYGQLLSVSLINIWFSIVKQCQAHKISIAYFIPPWSHKRIFL